MAKRDHGHNVGDSAPRIDRRSAIVRLGAGALGARLVPSFADEPPRDSRTRTIRPAPALGPLNNPLKSWAACGEPWARYFLPVSLTHHYVSWRELEPRQRDFRFDDWEKRAWDNHLSRDNHIVFRVYVDYPNRPSGTPEWLIEAGLKQRRHERHGGGLSPDYDSPLFVENARRLIRALGARYDKHPRVAFVQLGFLGFWGEWHTFPYRELFANQRTQFLIVEEFHRAFPNKILLARRPDGVTGKQPWLGYHDDFFPNDTGLGRPWEFLSQMHRNGRSDNWKRAAIGGEFPPDTVQRLMSRSFKFTYRMAEQAHLSWLGPYCPATEPLDDARKENACALARRMGYEYQLDEIRCPASVARGESLHTVVTGRNQGIAPFYYPWRVELALLNERGEPEDIWPIRVDIRDWLPGAFGFYSKHEPRVPAGSYRLALGIRDPWKDRPAIGFANDLSRREGWTILADVTVSG